MSCKNNPVELVIATTDKNLYDPQSKKWAWSGDMYWAVDCLPTRQTTVSNAIVPNVKNYQKISDTPTIWDFCESENCTPASQSMQIVLTFDPKSKNPQDYLQYVVNVNCDVTHSPDHTIKDSAGNAFVIDILEVSKLTKQPYVEIWIASGLPRAESDSLSITTEKTSNSNALWIIIGVSVLLLLIILAIIIYSYSYS